jgi:hypothetical protein
MFGDANSLAVAIFLGLFVGVPGVLIVVWLLIYLTLGSVNRAKSGSTLLTFDTDQLLGICPNCSFDIPIDSAECSYCRAIFGEHSSWRVLRTSEG